MRPPRQGLFARWGRRVYASRVRVLVFSGSLLVLSLVPLFFGGPLTTGTIRGIEAYESAHLVDTQLEVADRTGFNVLFHHAELTVDDPRYQAAVEAAVRPLRSDPRVLSVRTPWDEDGALLGTQLLSLDGHRAIALVVLRLDVASDPRQYPSLREKLRSDLLEITVTGIVAFKSGLDEVLEEDLVRAEVLSTPFTLIVLLIVFGSIVAATLPVGVGTLSVLGGVAGVLLLSRTTDVAQYAINIVSLVGLGVAIDYSLFIVNRFREELAAGESVEDAIATTIATAGRAVVFSGIAVAIGLSGLLFFRGSYLASLGMGGTLVVVLSAIYALTFLPALLGVLGHNVNRWKVPLPFPKIADGMWRGIALAVMKRPLLVLIPTLALLLAAGRPFLDLEVAIPDITVLPHRAEARHGDDLLREHFPERAQTRIAVVVQYPSGAPLGTPARIRAFYDLHQQLAAMPGVTRVDSVIATDPYSDREQWVRTLTSPAGERGELVRFVMDESVGRDIAVLAAYTESAPASEEARAIVRTIRRTRHCADGRVMVTGQTANDLDSSQYIREIAPYALTYVVVMTMLVLFLLLGSVVLPIKAVLMNLLSISASFGALVWIFQEGHLQSILQFEPGPIDPSLPIVMFCATFGLSMDYEVLLLTRMQEEFARHGDNTRAVAEGLEKSGRLITSAAAIMVVVFSAFSIADIILLKAMGVAMAIAVMLDATLVRILLVPATMRLFGDLNWWAPKPLAKLVKKLALHGE